MRTTTLPTPPRLAATAAAAALSLLAPILAVGHPEPFNYVRGAQVEPTGEWEIEQWTTARLGKKSGDYLGLDLSTEVEYGIHERLQAALYINQIYHHIDDADTGAGLMTDRTGWEFNGLSAELKYQLTDPYRAPWGFALYFEPGWGTVSRSSGRHRDEVFLEFKGIVERHFLDHRLIATFNYTVEPEWEAGANGDWETILEMEWSAGLAWRLNPRWSIGLEARVDTEWVDADPGQAEFWTFAIGPTMQWRGEDWFVALTALPQISGWPDAPGTGGRNLANREQIELRLRCGLEF